MSKYFAFCFPTSTIGISRYFYFYYQSEQNEEIFFFVKKILEWQRYYDTLSSLNQLYLNSWREIVVFTFAMTHVLLQIKYELQDQFWFDQVIWFWPNVWLGLGFRV
jgi:sensor histidine kinase YesM